MQIPTAQQAIARARKIAALPCSYVLGTGGRSPEADTPFTVRNGKLGADCVGFVLWAWGIDRYQPVDKKGIDFPFYDGWINTDSMISDAVGPQTTFETLSPSDAFPGCAAVYPSIWKDGKMVRMGHIGLVVDIPYGSPFTKRARDLWFHDVKVIDCAAALSRRVKGKAVAERTCAIWNKPDAYFIRLKLQPKQAPYLDLSPLPSLDVVMTAPKLGDRVLKFQIPMMRGSDVVELQRILGLSDDGWYGDKSTERVRLFQRINGLPVTGTVDATTASALRKPKS